MEIMYYLVPRKYSGSLNVQPNTDFKGNTRALLTVIKHLITQGLIMDDVGYIVWY